MEIKIDTKKDSAEDIRKMIAFLHHFINESSNMSSYPISSSLDNVPSTNELPGGAFNMFDNPPTSESLDMTPPSTQDDDSDEVPEIEPY